jgi:Protein of unknown function (DUF3142)
MPSVHILGRIALAALIAMPISSDHARRNRFDDYPKTTLWAWEIPSSFLDIDPQRYAVAYLDQTIIVEDRIHVILRRQPLAIAPHTRLIAVSRIEAHPGTADLSDPALGEKLAGIIADSLTRRATDAIQVDFDAHQSQRPFYSSVLTALRRQLPAHVPLSITALASWCAYDDWIGDLPVDEAVPMYFRMGPDHPASESSGWNYPVREPLCRGRAGVSTDEAWPKLGAGTRLYVFHRGAWNPIALSNLERHLP